MNPPSIFDWMALRDAYERSEHRWAARLELDDDGTARIYPLFVADLPAWVASHWDAPPDPEWSVAP
jgi:hypothetical protein